MATPQTTQTSEKAKPHSPTTEREKPTGRKPEMYVRLQERRNSRGVLRLELQLGRAAWYALDRPERVALEWQGNEVSVVPDAENGWKLHIRQYATPRCWLPGDIELTPGRYSASMRNGAIVLGAKERD